MTAIVKKTKMIRFAIIIENHKETVDSCQKTSSAPVISLLEDSSELLNPLSRIDYSRTVALDEQKSLKCREQLFSSLPRDRYSTLKKNNSTERVS